MTISKLLSGAGILAAMAIAPVSAYASDQPGQAVNAWTEEPSGGLDNADAGLTLPTANVTRGDGALNTITGQLLHTRDVDLYKINITDATNFNAVCTAGSGTGNTILYLFDAMGHGVTCNDDNPAGGITPRITGTFVSGPGMYFLGVSRISVGFGSIYQMALNAGATNMWPITPTNVEYAPTNPADVLTSWSNSPNPGFGDLFNYNYTVTLNGAGFATTPAPGAAGLLGLGGLLMARRRR
jgi:MYXO-CTERM domain-containing protein